MIDDTHVFAELATQSIHSSAKGRQQAIALLVGLAERTDSLTTYCAVSLFVEGRHGLAMDWDDASSSHDFTPCTPWAKDGSAVAFLRMAEDLCSGTTELTPRGHGTVVALADFRRRKSASKARSRPTA